jgi:hypothetical protein
MRHISFSMTTQAFRERRKTVTRRLGWWNLKPGDILMGVEKAQGLKKGEKQVKLGAIQIKSVRREPLRWINSEGANATELEGFPGMSSYEFVKIFLDHNARQCKEHGAETMVNRIEFEYLSESEGK